MPTLKPFVFPSLIAFDLDDTLAPSKSPAPERILAALERLLTHTHVAVISGGNLDQFLTQLVNPLMVRVEAAGEEAASNLENLHLLPTCGTRYYEWTAPEWSPVYIEDLSESERQTAMQVVEEEAKNLGLWEEKPWGDIIEDRGSQVTFSALGQRAPVSVKQEWDPTGEKKSRLRDAVAERLPDLEVRSGGSTSVDITRRGIDKAYGMRKLEQQTGVPLDDMLFVGDRLDTDGNDYPVLALGVPCRAVTGWEDTAAYLERILTRAA